MGHVFERPYYAFVTSLVIYPPNLKEVYVIYPCQIWVFNINSLCNGDSSTVWWGGEIGVILHAAVQSDEMIEAADDVCVVLQHNLPDVVCTAPLSKVSKDSQW